MRIRVLILISLTCLLSSFESLFALDARIGERAGYSRDSSAGRFVLSYELTELPVQKRVSSNLKNKIFSAKLVNEFNRKYKETFGENEIEQRFNTPIRSSDIIYSTGQIVSLDEDYERQNIYGEFVVKRLAEFHIDEFANKNPSIKKIIELKERISNLNLEVKKGYKLKVNYSLSANSLDLNITNPYDLYFRVSFKMDPNQFGPSKVLDEIVYLGYNFKNKTSINASLNVKSEGLNISTRKQLSPTLSASITAISQLNSFNYDKLVQDKNIIQGAEKKLIFGIAVAL